MSKDYKSKPSFEKAWREAVGNWNPAMAYWQHPSRGYEQSVLCLIVQGKVFRIHMYKSQYEIDQLVDQVRDFFDSGKFVAVSYWMIYTSVLNDDKSITSTDVNANVYEIPMKNTKGVLNPLRGCAMDKFMESTRRTLGDCGFRRVSSPDNDDNLVYVDKMGATSR